MTKRILVVGDIMIDRYCRVRTNRMAQEASIPIWDEVSRECRLGGAGNLANNLKSVGGDDVDVHLYGIYGDDEWDTLVALTDSANISLYCGPCPKTVTMVKERHVDENNRHVFRKDNIKRFSTDGVEWFSGTMEFVVRSQEYDAVVVSDYDKGTLTSKIASMLGRYRTRFVDSKRQDLRMFKGFTALKLNESEFSAQVSNLSYGTSFEGLFENCIITRGPNGAELRQYDHEKSSGKKYVVHSESFPIEEKIDAVDVTGCGDTHTAAALFCYLQTGDIRMAIRFANKCASRKVQKFGTETVKKEEIG